MRLRGCLYRPGKKSVTLFCSGMAEGAKCHCLSPAFPAAGAKRCLLATSNTRPSSQLQAGMLGKSELIEKEAVRSSVQVH